MGAKRYSAGAIFLQVVPVFADVQNQIQRHAKDMNRVLGDDMEKAGKNAGERAGDAAGKSMRKKLDEHNRQLSGDFEREFHKSVDGINNALDGIDTKRLPNKLRKELSSIKKDLAELKDVDIVIDADKRKADVALAELEARVRNMREDVKIVFRSDIDKALKGFAKIEAAKEAIADPVEIEVRVDNKPAERAISVFEKNMKARVNKAFSALEGTANRSLKRVSDQLKSLSDSDIGIDVSANRARAEIQSLMAELKELGAQSPDIDVRVATARAYAELAVFEAALSKIDDQDVTVDVDVDRDGRGARGFFRLAASGDDASNSFRSFNAILFAVTTLGPALVPVLAALAGGLLAIGPAAAVAGAGLSAVIIGFTGIGDALTALNARQDAAIQTTQQYAKTEVSSARAVANARRSAARAVASALDAQRAAQQRYRDSIQDVKDAEQALAEARAEARGTGADLNRQIKDNQLNIDQALLDSFNATVNYQNTTADGSATNAEKEQARIDMEQAKLRLQELRAEQRKLAKEKRQWDREGVDGTDAVQAAQDRLNNALDAQKDAYKALGDAARAVDQARADGARQVSEALQDQATALEDVNSQQANVEAAMAKLGPAGRHFARFIFRMRKDFYDFRDQIQSVLLPSIEQAIEGFLSSPSAKIAEGVMVSLADSFGRFVQNLSDSLQSGPWLKFFKALAIYGPPIQDAYGNAFLRFMEGMAGLLTTLAPYALDFAKGFERMMGAFADWANSKEGARQMQDFMGYVEDVAPDVIAFLKAFVKFAFDVAKGLAEWGGLVLNGVTAFLEFISGLDPKVLAAITTGLFIIISTAQTAYAIINLMLAGSVLLGSTVGQWAFIILGIGAALVYLYQTNEDFRKFVNKAWAEISAAINDAWNKWIKPALMDLWDALQMLWEEVLIPLFKWLGPIIVWYAKHLIPLLAIEFSIAVHVISWLIRHILVPVFKIIGKVLKWVWDHVIFPLLKGMKHSFSIVAEAAKRDWKSIQHAWEVLGDVFQWVWDHVLEPVFDFITDKALPALKEAFQDTVDGIKAIWDRLKAIVAKPVKFVIETVLNDGLIAGFNKVAGWVGLDGFNDIPVPQWMQQYATGGVMPGYTPGRDVHTFVSPTAGRLELSGGEAVMRPEWTQAVGKGTVDYWNQIARTKGVGALRQAMGMGGYWMGGVLPLPGARVSPHGRDQYPWAVWAGDMNVGSGYDDYGMGIHSWKKGIVAQRNYIGDASYGRWVVVNHGAGQNSLYAHMSRFGTFEVGESVPAGAVLGYVGDLGNTGTPPTSHLHMEIRGGAVNYADTGDSGEHHKSIPGSIMSIIKNPLGAVKHWIVDPIKDAATAVKDSPVFEAATKLPLLLAKKTTDKIWDIVPGWAKTAAGWAGNAADWTIGGVKAIGGAAADAAQGAVHGVVNGAAAVADWIGLADGGILPYNGTMKYDSGGYLPPGLTSVVNLTGRPEPVFTHDQWDNLDVSGGGDSYTYSPTFDGSNLTAEEVGGDMLHTMRRMRRRPIRYGGSE